MSAIIGLNESDLVFDAHSGADTEHFRITVTQHIGHVETAWRKLCAGRLASPGLSYDFIRLWVTYCGIPAHQQRFVLAERNGEPIALLPLHLKKLWDVRVLTWFPGAHVGCYTPIAELTKLSALGKQGRAQLWRSMLDRCKGADLVFLRSIPAQVEGQEDLFAELGQSIITDTLYRAEFSSWEICDREQRSRTRRKHDRQQSDRLSALGAVNFEEVLDPTAKQAAIEIMFRQRSERFRAQGIRDCFVVDGLTGFYHDVAKPGSGVDVRLHVLKLDGEIVAVRYNVVEGDRMFCLISSMTEDPALQSGSPGKQCLLRVMQTVFDQGIRGFDMGAGFSDEKRHWCNVQIPLRHHYIPLTPYGFVAAAGHGGLQRIRAWAKNNPRIKSAVRTWNQLRGGTTPHSDQAQSAH